MAADDKKTAGKTARCVVVRGASDADRAQERVKKMLEAASPSYALQEMMRSSDIARAYAAVEEAARIPVGLDDQWRRMFDSIEEQNQLARAALGPLEDFRRLGVLDEIASNYAHITAAVDQIQQQFRLPEFPEIPRLAQHVLDLTEGLNALRVPEIPAFASLENAMAQIHTPWLDIERTIESAFGFAKLQDVGMAVAHLNTFDDDIAAQLRGRLGDWRDSIVWPSDIDDIEVRTALYVERGLDTSLTDFPSPAFEESISVARLNTPAPRVIELDAFDIAGQTEAERSGLERTNAAQARLLQFEYHLRRFIDRQMKAAFGENWIRSQVDSDTRDRWREKQQAAADRGERGHALIDYADFTDYERVMLRKDNWKQAFQPVFRRRESVQESLQRLYPVRICSYHARLITQDDELLLYVETKRILRAMGIVD